jgi:hypothetical protein
MLAGQQAYRQYCRREKEIQRQCPVAEKPPQSPGVTAANFSAKFFAKFFRRELGGVPRDRLPRGRTARPPTGPRSGSDASDHPWGHARWSVADVDAILATLDRLYAMAAKAILARANFSSASRGCRRCWPTSNGHASTPRRKRPSDRIDRRCETIEELTAERAARFSGPPSWEAGLRPPPPASNLVAAMSSAARQAQQFRINGPDAGQMEPRFHLCLCQRNRASCGL